MNTVIQNQLDRVETALNTLITSIESYNPSVPAAIDLLTADTDLQEGVKQLTTHQANHTRILNLRSTIEAQNQQITSILTLLAETRKEVKSTPATVFPDEHRNVHYTEILDYAKRISRFTVPPASLESISGPKPGTLKDTDIDNTNATESQDAGPTLNGVSDAVEQARESNAVANGAIRENAGEKGVGLASLDQNEMQWLNPTTQIPFVPWPSEEVIKRGALGQLQIKLEQGIMEGEVGDSAATAGTNDNEKKDVKNELDIGARNRQDISQVGEIRERPLENVKKEEKPKVFRGLDLDEDSDDD